MNHPKVMLHVIMPNQISGPNSAVERIRESYLKEKYEFSVLTQTFHAGGKINLKLINDLRSQVKSVNPDLIHLTGLQASGFHAVLASRLATRVPILISVRGFSGDSLAATKLQKFVFNYLVEPLTLAMSTRFLTVTHAAGRRKMVKKFSRKYLGALHNAAPIWSADRIRNDDRASERERLEIPKNFVVTVVGRMVTDKGIPTILEVAEGLPAGFTVCLVGDGPWVDIISNEYGALLESKRIVLLGQRSDVREILGVSDVFLFATLHENLSNALLEAMSLALPTVVTNVGGNPEVVIHEETGYLVEPGDATAIISHLMTLKQNPQLSEKMGLAGRARIEKIFSQEYIYKSLDMTYEKLLANNLKGN